LGSSAAISACLIIALAHWESAWGYLFLIDILMSVIILTISYDFNHPLIVFGILGTLWWYLLSRAAEMVLMRQK
jgi:hypothetical protein